LDCSLIAWSELEAWPGDDFEGEGSEGAVEMSKLPALPAHDVGAALRIAREERVAAGLIGKILHDGVRFPKGEGTVDKGWNFRIWIDGEVIRMAQSAEIVLNDLDIEAQMIDDRFDPMTVGRTLDSVQLHSGSPPAFH